MRLLWEEEAWEDYCLWQTRDKKLLKRINTLLKDIQRNTYEGIGKPEPLKGRSERLVEPPNRRHAPNRL